MVAIAIPPFRFQDPSCGYPDPGLPNADLERDIGRDLRLVAPPLGLVLEAFERVRERLV
jgi:hypothetical protein